MATTDPKNSSESCAEDSVCIECDACKQDGKSEFATFYCTECADYMCNECEAHHKKVKATRAHKILDGKDMPKRTLKNIAAPVEETAADTTNATRTANPFLDASVSSHWTIDVTYQYDKTKPIKSHSDQSEPNITGLAFMPCGDLVVIDSQNQRLKLLDKSLKLKDVISFEGAMDTFPHDVGLINDKEIVVTFPQATPPQLLYLTVYPQLKHEKKIELSNSPSGIAVSKGNIYLACYRTSSRNEILVLSINGELQQNIDLKKVYAETQCHSPDRIATNAEGRKLYMTGYSGAFCMTVDGNVVYSVKEAKRNCAEGIVVDEEGNAFVCFRDANEIVVLNSDGAKHKTLLTGTDGIKRPRAIAYRARDRLLVIACSGSGASLVRTDKVHRNLLVFNLA